MGFGVYGFWTYRIVLGFERRCITGFIGPRIGAIGLCQGP